MTPPPSVSPAPPPGIDPQRIDSKEDRVILYEIPRDGDGSREAFLSFNSEADVPAANRKSSPAATSATPPPRRGVSIPLAIAFATGIAAAAAFLGYTEGVRRASAAASGGLEVVSEPAGAMVTVDGVARGVTPLHLPDMAPGTYAVVIASADRTMTRTIAVQGGAISSILAVMHPAGDAHDPVPPQGR